MTGDQDDLLARLKGLLPSGWHRGETPVLDAVLSGAAAALSRIYSLAAYARLQTRIATATDGFLDLIALDFFGDALPRRPGESDDAYRARIRARLLLERGTRRGLILALEQLTGRTPDVFEPARPADAGAYGANSLGYGVAGGYGSLSHRAQVFVTAYRPEGSGIPHVAGYGSPPGGYSTPGRARWSNLSEIEGYVTDEDLYSAIDAVKPAGVTVWTRLSF